MTAEADIACNPVKSLHPLHYKDSSTEKKNPRDMKRNKASVFTTQTAKDNENQKADRGKVKTPCIYCQDNKHQLHACHKFTELVLAERRNYVKDNKLCYGCLKAGHNAKDCHHRHFCGTCKGKHATVLHDDNYKKEGPSSETGTNQGMTAGSLSVAAELIHQCWCQYGCHLKEIQLLRNLSMLYSILKVILHSSIRQ